MMRICPTITLLSLIYGFKPSLALLLAKLHVFVPFCPICCPLQSWSLIIVIAVGKSYATI